MTLPNLLCGNDPTTQQIFLKFHCKLFEWVIKRFIRPEMTSNNLSSNALLVKLASIDNQALTKTQQEMIDKEEYTALYSNVYNQWNYKAFKMPFEVSEKSLFKSGLVHLTLT